MRIDLRSELRPPVLDEALVARLVALASRIDGEHPDLAAGDVAEFNSLARTDIPHECFQDIWRSEDHEHWVRRVLFRNGIAPILDATRAEMAEIVQRVRHANDTDSYLFYPELFEAACRHPAGSNLLFWPNLVPELPQDREPTPEEIADLALRGPA